MKSETYIQSKQPLVKNQYLKFFASQVLAVTVSKSEEKKEVIFDHSSTLTQPLLYDILGAFVKT